MLVDAVRSDPDDSPTNEEVPYTPEHHQPSAEQLCNRLRSSHRADPLR